MTTETWINGHLVTVWGDDVPPARRFYVAVDRSQLLTCDGRPRIFRSRHTAHQAGVRKLKQGWDREMAEKRDAPLTMSEPMKP